MMHSRNAGRLGLMAALALVSPGNAWAQDDKPPSWAASCASCHGTGGRNAGAVPSIAGRSKADLLTLLMEFKQGKRPTATVMHQYAKGYSDAQLERIAEHFSQQPR